MRVYVCVCKVFYTRLRLCTVIEIYWSLTFVSGTLVAAEISPYT